MKKIIKKIAPIWLLKWYRNRKKEISKFQKMGVKEVFTEIYDINYWNSKESFSGGGSELIQTETLINELEKITNILNIKSILDIPCGDFKWMQKANLDKINYIGADIVEKLILSNSENNREKKNITFQVINLINDPLPKSDLLFIRDCFVHLSYDDIYISINNIKSSGCKYLLTTTFTNHNINTDITTGDWRPINLQEKPFNFPNPLLIINENCTEGNGAYKDKSMALWEVNSI
jgi:hypothetical protein